MIRQAEDERTFHIFYQLLSGTSAEQKSECVMSCDLPPSSSSAFKVPPSNRACLGWPESAAQVRQSTVLLLPTCGAFLSGRANEEGGEIIDGAAEKPALLALYPYLPS